MATARCYPASGRRYGTSPGRILIRVWLPLVVVVVVLVVALAGWAGWRTARDRPVILRQLWAGAVVEALLLVQVVVAVVQVARGHDPAEGATFWGYLVTVLVILPLAALWAFAERTRWSSVVLLVAALTVAFLQYRLLLLWGAA